MIYKFTKENKKRQIQLNLPGLILQKYMKKQLLINSKNGKWKNDFQFTIFKNFIHWCHQKDGKNSP